MRLTLVAIAGSSAVLFGMFSYTSVIPAPIHVTNCTQQGCPVVKSVPDGQLVRDTHLDIPKGSDSHTVYPPGMDGTGIDPGAFI